MTHVTNRRRLPHRHHDVVVHVIEQRGGIPYELERRVCRRCGRQLAQRRVRRAAA